MPISVVHAAAIECGGATRRLAGALLLAGIAAAPLQAQHQIAIAPEVFTEPPGAGGSVSVTVRATLTRSPATSTDIVSTRLTFQPVGGANPAVVGINTGCPARVDVSSAQDALTWAGNESGTKEFQITLCGDALDENDEEFQIGLTQSSANVAASQPVRFTIRDNADDLPPTVSVSVSPANIAEGNTGTTTAAFTVALSRESGKPITVAWALENVTSTGLVAGAACGDGIDYATTTNRTSPLTFAAGTQATAGTTSITVNVPICGDTQMEPNETLRLTLGTITNATAGTASASVTITNDDQPAISVAASFSGSTAESEVRTVTYTVSISAAPVGVASQATLDFGPGQAEVAGSCTDPRTDAMFPQGSPRVFRFDPGEQTPRQVTLTVCNDARDDADAERVIARLTNFSNAVPGTSIQTEFTILDDDPSPTISVEGTSVTEPTAAGTTATGTVTVRLSAPSNRTVPFVISTADGLAIGSGGSSFPAVGGSSCGTTVDLGAGPTPVDFRKMSPNVESFSAGATSRTYEVTVCHDGIREGVRIGDRTAGVEHFRIILTVPNTSPAVAGTTSATVQIRDP
jgi:hypothetical protein